MTTYKQLITNYRLPITDNRYLGIPFKWMGRGFDGCDCLGLAYLYYRDRGIVLPLEDGEGKGYSMRYEDEADDRMVELMLRWGGLRRNPREGDVILLGLDRVTHCGIYAGGGRFLNQQRSGGCSRVSDMREWFPYFKGVIRVGRYKESCEEGQEVFKEGCA